MMEPAIDKCKEADIFVVVGTSLLVYPAAGLINYINNHTPKYIVNPNMPEMELVDNLHLIHKGAGEGLAELREIILMGLRGVL
jgi:NAD-dependent deacetylase